MSATPFPDAPANPSRFTQSSTCMNRHFRSSSKSFSASTSGAARTSRLASAAVRPRGPSRKSTWG